jgi:RimJ/RimL family protein N-acetyltransferase
MAPSIGFRARTSPAVFDAVCSALMGVSFNCLFARSVADRLVDGEIWCDREREPTFAHVVHPYGMTLLLALSPDMDFAALREHVDACRRMIGGLWMQVHPHSLAAGIDRVLEANTAPIEFAPNDTRVQRFTRCNFRFVPERYAAMAPMRPLSREFKVRPMTSEDFALTEFGVSPRHFWRNAYKFLAHGGGWCVANNEELISIAFSSFRLDSQLEIGVETHPKYRGRGFAKYATSAIIDQCLESGIEPIWSCRKQNLLSYHLAQTLGFSPTVEGPYYHLPKVSSQS